jgi:hypothetical protein
MFAPPRPLQLSALVLLLVSVPSFSQSVQKGVRASASATAPKTWEANPHLDPITDKPILEAKLVTPAQSNGRLGTFLTTASCNLQTGLVSFQVVYKSISENGVGFLHKPRVPVRVRIDRFEASNLFLAGDYPNEVKFSFASEFKQTVESALERMTSVGETKDLYSAEVIKFEFMVDPSVKTKNSFQ